MNSSEFDYQDLSIWNINSIIEYIKEIKEMKEKQWKFPQN